MCAGIAEVPSAGRPGEFLSLCDRALVSALREVRTLLDAKTFAAYLPLPGRACLGVAVALDTPCSFTLPSELDLHDMRMPTVRAFQTGELVVAEAVELRRLVRQAPAFFMHTPYPLAMVSAPLVAEGQTFGCLNVQWSRTCAPEIPVPTDDLHHLQRIADKLARRLLHLQEAGEQIEAPAIPKFLPPTSAAASGRDAADITDPPDGSVTSSTCLYQLKRLSTELAAAVQVRDVIAAAKAHVMSPFGATALMLCRAQEARLHVVGSSGFSRDEVGSVEGTLLSNSSPETETVTRVESRLSRPGGPPARAGSALALEAGDRHPLGYMPMIANGRAIGCCVLRFPADWQGRPTDEDIALAALMLGQIGQALERIYAHEVEHAFALTMQQSLLPPRLPLNPQTVFASRYLAATQGAALGGDWYDVVSLPDGGIGLAVGDVEGHNPQASGVMGHLRSALLAYASEGHQPATILERIDVLLRTLGASHYATCCCLWLDTTTGLGRLATAGHPLPLISPAPGKLKPLDVPIGPPLGLGDGHHYQEREITLEPGSVTALFTDGLLEVRALGPEEALARLGSKLTGGDRENLETLADDLISERRRQEVLDDDLALLLMRFEGVQPDQQDVARLAIQRYDLQAVAAVRHQLHDLLGRWQSESILDELELVLSEIVTNALIHGQSDVDIRMRRHVGGIRVEVQDSSPQPPVPTVIVADDAVNAEAESGRGLLIVDALAKAWGSSPAGRGKTTWIEMALSPPAP
jgi:serine phosphatase RsbU (regulator of sigma subunit)/anti-sigma regulatory factor (Ser/Thr protein kinase)